MGIGFNFSCLEGTKPYTTHMETNFAFDHDGLASNDDFHRKGFAARLAKVIQQQPTGECLVVALISEWGAGKSSVLQWMHSSLAGGKQSIEESACITVTDFNPWGVTGDRDMLFRLYENLVKKIDPDGQLLTRWQRARQLFGQASRSAGKMAEAADQKVAGAALGEAGGLFESLCQVGIAEVRRGVEERLAKSPWRLVVILDDIDRLERNDLMILLRILKREAALPNVTYILSMDEAHVVKTIGGDSQDAEERGHKYLEKIIQVKLQLPAIPPQLLKAFAQHHIQMALGDSSPVDTECFRTIFDALFLPRINTPRTVKLIANTIRFTAGLLPGEVDSTDLALLECARHLFPALYERIKRGESHLKPSSGYFMAKMMNRQDDAGPPPYRTWLSKAWEDARLGDPSDEEQQAIGIWFPQANNENLDADQENQLWRNQRLCSPAYHWRYFAYAIIRGDVADSEVEELKIMCLANAPDAAAKLKLALANERGRVITEKLCRLHYTKEDASALIQFLAQHFSDQRDSVTIAIRIFNSLSDKSMAEETALAVVKLASTEWAAAWLDSLPADLLNQQSQHNGGIPHQARAILSQRQLERLQTIPRDDTGTYVEDIWSVWHFGDVQRLKQTIAHHLEEDPSFAYVLLASACSRAIGREPPRIWHWNGHESIKPLQRITSIESLQQALSKLDPPQIVAENEAGHGYCSPEELVPQFSATLENLNRPVGS